MTKHQLAKRQKKVIGSRGILRPDANAVLRPLRRDKNFVEAEHLKGLPYDDFFEFEQDYLFGESARDLAAKSVNAKHFFESEEIEEEKNSFILMEKIKEESKLLKNSVILPRYSGSNENENTPNIPINTKQISAEAPKRTIEFKQCSYIKENNEQCKRQAPNKDTLCSAHRKIVYGESDVSNV